MKGRNLAILHDGLPDQIRCGLVAAGLMGEHAEKMQAVRMTRGSQQNLPVKPLRLPELPGLMLVRGDREHLVDPFGCFALHIAASLSESPAKCTFARGAAAPALPRPP